jgi:hypothetical protein
MLALSLTLVVVLGTYFAVQSGRVDIASLTRWPHTRLHGAADFTIVRHPPAMVFPRRPPLTTLPHHTPGSGAHWQVDLRSRDLSALDVSKRGEDLRHADFDTVTRWPKQLPEGFDPGSTLTRNRNPGLGLRALHAQGVTGQGIGIGIIDQALLVDHEEYRDRLRSYEEIHLYGDTAQMHGPAVASIAVGRTTGVAPGADLYYIATTHGVYEQGKYVQDFVWLARAVDRMLVLNASLPPGRKIRVLSLSIGWSSSQRGYGAINAAAARAREAGIFVLSTSLERTYRLSFHGLGRAPDADPDAPAAYGPGEWWAADFWSGHRFGPGERLLVPMDARAVASPTGPGDYVFYSMGGWSWSVPWIAGLYALACEVRPDITPRQFWAEALRTGTTIRVRHGSQEIDFGTVANPGALIAALRRGDRIAGTERVP